MEEIFDQLLNMVLRLQATDIHMTLKQHKLQMQLRVPGGMEIITNPMFDETLFHYLKYKSNLDLGLSSKPQSGNFTYVFNGKKYYFRFALLSTFELETGVLRILNNHQEIFIDQLSKDHKQIQQFKNWGKSKSGLVLLSGPTCSGKSTTLHAILRYITSNSQLNVVSLEDPIEIRDNSYLQLQINEKTNFTYEEGLKQLLRHDPDVIMIGEIRDAKTAKMVLRAALSGHMIFSTVHAKNCREVLKRLEEFGLNMNDLKDTLTALCSQRLYTQKNNNQKLCIYEIMEKEDLNYYLETKQYKQEYEDIYTKIKKACSDGLIDEQEAEGDLIAERI